MYFVTACALVWCGDGTCVTNGTGYKCQCNDGSANLLNSQALACFKECKLIIMMSSNNKKHACLDCLTSIN